MARSDLIIILVKAGIEGAASEVRALAEAIAADERAKKHGGVADRIVRTLERTKPSKVVGQSGPAFRPRDGSGGIHRTEPMTFHE